MNPTTINTVQNDFNYPLNFTLNNSAGVAIDLTGATAVFSAQIIGAEAIKFSGNMTLDTPTSGICHYTVQSSNFDTEGQYNASITVTFPSGEVLTFPNILVYVSPALPIE